MTRSWRMIFFGIFLRPLALLLIFGAIGLLSKI